MNPLHIVHIAIGGALALLSIPLVLRKVPRNSLYGVRIPKAFSSEARWYDINAYGGRLLFVYGVLLVGYGVVARGIAPDPKSLWSLPFVVAPLLLALPVIALILSYAKRLP